MRRGRSGGSGDGHTGAGRQPVVFVTNVVNRHRGQTQMRFPISFRSFLGMIAMLAALPCLAGEVAVLRNGFSIAHERREVVGDITRLYVTADGSSFVDVPTAEIEHFETAPEVPASGSRLPASGEKPRSPLFANNARNG